MVVLSVFDVASVNQRICRRIRHRIDLQPFVNFLRPVREDLDRSPGVGNRLLLDVLNGPLPHDPRRNTGHDAERGDVPQDHRVCPDDAAAPDADRPEDLRARPTITFVSRVGCPSGRLDPTHSDPRSPSVTPWNKQQSPSMTVSLPITKPNPCTMTIPGPRSAW